MNATIEAEFRALSPAERILLVEEIWDRIMAEPEAVPVSPAQQAELDRRLDALEKSPDAERPWTEVLDELLRRLCPSGAPHLAKYASRVRIVKPNENTSIQTRSLAPKTQ